MIPDKMKRFPIVGAVNAGFGYGVTLLAFEALGDVWVTPAIIAAATAVNISFSFLTNKLFVFRTKGNWLEEYLKCYLVYGVGSLISGLLLWGMVDYLQIPVWIASAIAIILVAFLTYFGLDRFTFAKGQGRPARPTTDTMIDE